MDVGMPILVSLAGLAVAGIGLAGVVAPTALTRRLGSWRIVVSLPLTVALRLVLGAIFVVAAPDCRVPALVRFVGILELTGAAVLLAFGAARLERFVDWWLLRPAVFVRCWCIVVTLFGGVLVYAGA